MEPTHLTNEQLDWCWRLWDALEREGEDHFNLGHWAHDRVERDWSLLALVDGPKNGSIDITECGTTACIAGHMMFVLEDDERLALRAIVDNRERGMDAESALRYELGNWLGMGVNAPADYRSDSWFLGVWPAWAQDMNGARHLKLVSGGVDSLEATRRAEYFVVRTVVDDIVHGRRQDWWTPLDDERGEDVIEYSYFGDDD